jgi:methionyl-tRNA synthetase
LGVELPHHVVIHGWILLGHEKLSKSKGITLDPDQLAQDYGVDAIRYFVSRDISFGNDGSFTYDSLVKRYNGDLSNDIGNLVSRTVTMVNKFAAGKVPSRPEEDGGFRQEWEKTQKLYQENMENFRFSDCLIVLWDFINKANKYIEDTQPWSLAKSDQPQDLKKLEATLYQLVEAIRLSAVLVSPFMPHICQKILGQFGIEDKVDSLTLKEHSQWGSYSGGTLIGEKEILFPRIKED